MMQALKTEIQQRRSYLPEAEIDTIYFGGGTPSLLSAPETEAILDQVDQFFRVKKGAEITLEANPDDLTAAYLRDLRQTRINRFSIGIQSFFDEDLRFMNRAHNAGEADAAAKRAQDAGFENLSIDLIYGFPLLTDEKWNANLRQATALDVPHISAYALTVEPRTALAHQIAAKRQPEPDEAQSAAHFETLMDTLDANGYMHYEISNFCRPGHFSRHNTSYWTGEPYLGIGPSAHSFDGESRQWNIAQNNAYMDAIFRGENSFAREELSEKDRMNEYIMIRLRMQEGLEERVLSERFGIGAHPGFAREVSRWTESGHLVTEDGFLRLTRKGKLYADRIASDLFI